jgi:hypothetical protein
VERQKDVCLISTIHDDKMAPTRIRGEDTENPNVIIDCDSGMEGVDLNDAYSTKYGNTRKRLKKVLSKALSSLD